MRVPREPEDHREEAREEARALGRDDAELLAPLVDAREDVREQAGKVHEHRVLAGALVERADEHRQHRHLQLDEAVGVEISSTVVDAAALVPQPSSFTHVR